MKQKDKQDLQTKEAGELKEMAVSLRKEIFQLNLDKSLGKLDNTRSLFNKRKDLARVLTVLSKKEKVSKKGAAV